MAGYNTTRGLTIPLLVFAFCTWAVYLAGLAATQHYCLDGTTGQNGAQIAGQQSGNNLNTAGLQGIFGFSGNVLFCKNVYRFHWFIMAFEFVCILGALVAAAMTYGISHSRGFWVGMFSIATLLYMIASEAFLAGISSDANSSGSNLASFRTAAAGAIMTVVANIAVLFAIGSDWERAHTREKETLGGTTATAV